MLGHSCLKELVSEMKMMPATAIGPHNYDVLGNQRVGETHASRMARVNQQSNMMPTLVGQASNMNNINGAKPMAKPMGLTVDNLTNPVAYGLLGGAIGGLLSQYATSKLGTSKTKQRTSNAVVAMVAGATAAIFSQDPADENSYINRYGVSPIWTASLGAVGATALTLGLGRLGMYERKKVKGFREAVRQPSVLAIGIGVPVVLAGLLTRGDKRDQAVGGLVGALAAGALVMLGHQAMGTVLRD